MAQKQEPLAILGLSLTDSTTFPAPSTGSVDIWGALKTKGEKGGEEGWMRGPIVPVMLPKGKKVSAAQEIPWGLTL